MIRVGSVGLEWGAMIRLLLTEAALGFANPAETSSFNGPVFREGYNANGAESDQDFLTGTKTQVLKY